MQEIMSEERRVEMREITKKFAKNHLAKPLLKQADELVLPFLLRSKSRLRATLQNGEEVSINLPRGGVMRDGEVLIDTNGRFILVRAALETILRVEAEQAFDLMRAAYHLGNRHTPIEIGQNYLHLENDPVLAQMLHGLKVKTYIQERAFEPEHGAYGGGHKHGHDATFPEDYALAQAVFKEHDHSTCGHDHSHDHSSHDHSSHDHPHDHPHNHSHDHGH